MNIPNGGYPRKSVEVREVRNGYLLLLNTHACDADGKVVETIQDQDIASTAQSAGGLTEAFLAEMYLNAPAIPDTSADHYENGIPTHIKAFAGPEGDIEHQQV